MSERDGVLVSVSHGATVRGAKSGREIRVGGEIDEEDGGMVVIIPRLVGGDHVVRIGAVPVVPKVTL